MPVKKKTTKKKATKKKGGSSDEAFLTKKAASSGISKTTLRKVLQRGKGAYLSSGSRRGASMQAWSRGRVNSFIRGSRKHDTDLRRGGAKKKKK
jgi:hypothetical protein